MNNFSNLPSWAKPNQPKKPSIQELVDERKRLTEITKIRQLQMKDKELYKKQYAYIEQERQQRLKAVKRIGVGVTNVIKTGLQKVSEFDKSRLNAEPIIKDLPFKKKSVYD